MALLHQEFSKILEGNASSKILILTHDRAIASDFCLVSSDIFGVTDRDKHEAKIYHLQRGPVPGSPCTVPLRDKNLYSALLYKIFRFASTTPIDASEALIMGNVMRRVFEMFATFMFRKDIIHVMKDEDIQNDIKDKKFIEYIQHRLTRFVLHGESHTEAHVRKSADHYQMSNPYFEKEEIQQTATDVLSFIYCISPGHIFHNLYQEKLEETRKLQQNLMQLDVRFRKEVKDTIEGWIEEKKKTLTL